MKELLNAFFSKEVMVVSALVWGSLWLSASWLEYSATQREREREHEQLLQGMQWGSSIAIAERIGLAIESVGSDLQRLQRGR